jgi:hypothetical protein
MPKTILHFDTVDGIDNYDSEIYYRLKARYGNQISSHTFNTKLTLTNSIEKVKSISLLSCEMPFNFFNCRAENYSNSLSFAIVYRGITSNLSITLTPKNYISISDLLLDINNAITSRNVLSYPNLVGFEMIFSVNTTNSSKITIKANADLYVDPYFMTCANIVFNKSPLGLMLGVSFNKTITVGDVFLFNTETNYSFMHASGSYTLQPDNYVLLNFTNIRKSTSGSNNRNSSFKIVLNGSFGEVLSYEPIHKQTILLDDQLIDHLNVKITDRNGNSIWGNGGFISFSLELEH